MTGSDHLGMDTPNTMQLLSHMKLIELYNIVICTFVLLGIYNIKKRMLIIKKNANLILTCLSNLYSKLKQKGPLFPDTSL